MLRQEIIDAVATEKFHIYAVATIADGIEILTGLPAGQRDEQGKIERRLTEFADLARAFQSGAGKEETRDVSSARSQKRSRFSGRDRRRI
jgi:hypothetical protein